MDAYGGCICVKDEEVESDVPYMESWKCSKCGAHAKEYECAGFAFKEDGLTGTLLVPRYPLTEGYLFWDIESSCRFVAYSKDACLMDFSSRVEPAGSMTEEVVVAARNNVAKTYEKYLQQRII